MSTIIKPALRYLVTFMALMTLAVTTATATMVRQEDPDRTIYDLTVSPPMRGATVLKLTLGTPETPLGARRTLHSFSIHLKSGNGWLTCPSPISTAENGRTVFIPLSGFTPDSDTAGLAGVTVVRVSAWGAAAEAPAGTDGAPLAEFVKPTIGLVMDPAFDRTRAASRLGDAVTFFTASDLDAIKKFSANGGRIVVAYSANPALAAFMGVTPGRWQAIDAAALATGGQVLSTYKTDGVIAPGIPAANPLHARVTATILDSRLRDTGVAGAIETDRGIWYAHGVPAAPMRPGVLKRLPAELPVRGVWADGAALDRGGWDGMARQLAAAGFNTLFVRENTKNFARILRAGHAAGLKVHAWLISFGDSGRRPERAADRAALVTAVRKLARMKVDGIELDYFRYDSGALADASARSRAAAELTKLLESVHSVIRYGHPGMKLSVAIFPTPASRAAVGQDAAAWMKADLADFVSPMCYTEDPTEFNRMLTVNLAEVPATKLVVGVGSGADESRLDATQIGDQLAAATKMKLGGAVLFMLDAELAARLGNQ